MSIGDEMTRDEAEICDAAVRMYFAHKECGPTELARATKNLIQTIRDISTSRGSLSEFLIKDEAEPTMTRGAPMCHADNCFFDAEIDGLFCPKHGDTK